MRSRARPVQPSCRGGSIPSVADYYMVSARSGRRFPAECEEVHSFANDLERPIGTYLYGRKLYEIMAVWEAPEVFPLRCGAAETT